METSLSAVNSTLKIIRSMSTNARIVFDRTTFISTSLVQLKFKLQYLTPSILIRMKRLNPTR